MGLFKWAAEWLDLLGIVKAKPAQPVPKLTAEKVTLSEESIRCTRQGHPDYVLPWSDLTQVEVFTTGDGPFAEDVFFVLRGGTPEQVCIVPQSAEGNNELVDRLLALPGFDHNAFIVSMTSASEARSLCWRK